MRYVFSVSRWEVILLAYDKPAREEVNVMDL